MSGDSEEDDFVTLTGKVSSGKKEGKFFLSKKKYKEQIMDLFGIDPKEGTLNLELNEHDLNKFRSIRKKGGAKIEGFEENGDEFGDVIAFDAKIDDIKCAVLIPERSEYNKILEIISNYRLRDELDLKDGDILTIELYVNWS